MPPDRPHTTEKDEEAGYNYEADPRWRGKPLTPAQVLVNDIRLERWRRDVGPLLEIKERFASSLVPETASITPSASYVRAAEAATNPIEQQRFARLEEEYGWMRYLRLEQYQQYPSDSENSAKCRWIHISSKFPEYLRGALWALTDDLTTVSKSLQLLDDAIQQHTRFSQHGKYFSPFARNLSSRRSKEADAYPMLICLPFLDWSIQGEKPPLRFQVDRREGYNSARSASHQLRTVLQHFYRLEDTSDREASQVFARHRPWGTNRDLDLKVRQWYGHYPTALTVDELWILLVDSEHIVTFSSNQTWKSRWPPLQLSSRISDISFRGLRNAFFRSEYSHEYTSTTHAIAALSGAVGMMHRNFWPDLVLPAVDRYAGHLGHLQYRLHRSPSTKLVMDLIACQEELNIVIQITEQQLEMMTELQTILSGNVEVPSDAANAQNASPISDHQPQSTGYGGNSFDYARTTHHRATYRQLSTSPASGSTPIAQVLDNLNRELADLQDLRDNADRLVTRTIQLVNIRLEDHGKAILVFTVVTIIFLPLNFISSFFGMNFSDIRDMDQTQWVFWAVALCVTAAVVGFSLLLAFSGGKMYEKFLMWKDRFHERRASSRSTANQQPLAQAGESGFRVLGVDRDERWNTF